MNIPNTDYAPAERANKESLTLGHIQVKSENLLTEVMESLPYVAAVLNQERQFLFVNKSLLKIIEDNESITDVIGLRLGEAINCIHATEGKGGCGTSKDCKYCGAVNSILECQNTQEQVIKECRITSTSSQGGESFDYSVSSNPITISDHHYTLLVIKDISDEKRRIALERIFFHDVINKAGSMDGLVEIMEEVNDLNEIKRMLSVIQTVTHDLVGEIQAQRDLLSAENGDFNITASSFDPRVMIAEIAEQMRHHIVSKGRSIETIIASETIQIQSDRVLLGRVLTNLLKNAIEATPVGESVSVMIYDKDDKIGFCIQNPTVMPDNIKSQIFQRSFSTKDNNRGLGTYSAKLLGERYLKGKVHFTSTKEDGTQFDIEIPKKIIQ